MCACVRNGTGWFAVILITEFNIFDYVGRTLPRYKLLFTPETLW